MPKSAAVDTEREPWTRRGRPAGRALVRHREKHICPRHDGPVEDESTSLGDEQTLGAITRTLQTGRRHRRRTATACDREKTVLAVPAVKGTMCSN